MTFETFAQSDEKTLSIWPKWATTMTKTKTMTNAFREQPERAIFETTTKTKSLGPVPSLIWPIETITS